jgi:4-amino-4-deoxy-L-arabinose transferase-like glycosyltransferase
LIGRAVHLIGRLPRAGRACFAIAFVNAAIWTVLTPPFQVPDEVVHFAYAQYLAETGRPPPQTPTPPYSPQEYAAIGGLLTTTVIGRPDVRGVLTAADDRALRAELAASPNPKGSGGASPATNQPPLYYALETIPYWLSPSGDILWRLALMRLLSAAFAAATVLCVFLFLRELLPEAPWTWTVGALAVAFQPQFMFIASGVHVDALLFASSAATFLALARAHRRGLNVSRAAAIGAAVAAGLMTKLTFVALLPGIVLGVGVLAWRARARGPALRAVGVALVVVVAPVGVYALLNTTIWHRGSPTAGGFVSIAAAAGGHAATLRESLDYIWELYLPRLPVMNHAYFSGYPLLDVWLNGAIGRFGWLDYGFPRWVYSGGRWVFGVLAALAVVGSLRFGRTRIRAGLPMLAAFVAMAAGLLAAIGWQGLRYRLQTGFAFEQARYLFPLLPLYGLFIAVAVSGAPRRWAPALGAGVVVLAMAHDLYAQMLTISRYYG